ISTCAVHGAVLGDRPLDETQPLWPNNHYGACKAALEAFVHSFGLGEQWPICALRPSGIYGLARPVAASKWYDLVGKVVRGEPIATAEGEHRVHAEDVARAVELLLRADAKTVTAQSYLCSDMYLAEQEVARLARALAGSNSAISDLNRGPTIRFATGKLR